MKKRPTYQELQNKIKELESKILSQRQTNRDYEIESGKAQQYLDIAEVMLIALDKHGKITFLNRKGHQILGYEQGALIGKPWFDTCLPVRVRSEAKRVFRELMTGALVPLENYENEVLTKQGQERLIAWHNTVFKDESGQIIGSFSSGEDISERKKMESALRESEERYRRITETVTDYIFTVQIDEGRVMRTVHGPACIAVTGYTSEEFAADPYLWIRMVLVEDHPKVQEQAAHILKGGDPGPIQHRIRRKDGSIRWVNNTPVLHRDAQGRLVAYDGLIRDITERKMAEDALRLAQYSVEQVPMIIGRIGADGRLLYTNEAATRNSGFSREDLARMKISDISPDIRQEEWPDLWRQIKEKGSMTLEVNYKTKDGRLVPAEFTGHFMKFEDQEFILGFGKNITERKQAESLALLQRDLAIALSTSNDLKEALNLVLLAGMQIDEIDCGGVYLVDPITGALDLIVHAGLSSAFIAQTSHYEPDAPNTRLVKRGLPVYTQHSQMMGKLDPARISEGLHALAVLPVQAEGRVIAVINLASHKHNEIPLSDRSTLETLAAQVGGAIARLQAQEALRVSQYSVEHAPFPMARIDSRAQFLYVNEATCRHFGYTKEELLSMGIADITPDFSDKTWVQFWGQLQQKKTIVSETRHKDKKGRVFPVELTNHLMEFEGRQYVFSSAKDMTERKQVENLANLQRDLAFALSSTNDLKEALNLLIQTSTKIEGVDCGGIYLIDPSLGSLELLAHVGLSEPFVKESSHYEPDSPNARLVKLNQPIFKKYAEIAPQMDEIRRREGLRAMAVLPVRVEDRVIALLNLASHTYDEIPPAARATLETLAAQVGGAITRLQAQEAMRESEEKHRRLYETMPQGIVYQDSEGKIISANAAAEKILGVKLEDMKGHLSTDQSWQSIHEDGSDFPGETHPSMISLRTGQPVKDRIMGLNNPSRKQTRWIKIDAIPLFHPGESKPYQVYTTFDDITDRKRAEEEIQHRASEFAALYETASDLATHQDLPTLLRTIVERAVRLLHAANGEIYLYDATRHDMEIVITTDPHFPKGTRLSMGEGMAGRVAQSRESLIVKDYRAWPHRSPQYEGVPVGAVVEVPMLYSGELIGVLAVHEEISKPREFDQADAHLLSLFAAQAASAVHNARLFQETTTRAEQLELLYDAGLTLNRVLDPRLQLESLVKIAMKTLRAERAEFFRLDAVQRVMRFEFGIDINGTALNALKDLVFSIDEERGMHGWVSRHRTPLNVPDLSADPRWVATDTECRSGLWVPIEHENQLQGILTLLSTRLNAFSPQHEWLVTLFANQVAVAMQNTRLFQETQQQAQRQEALYRISISLASLKGVKELCETVVQACREILGYRHLGIFLKDMKTGNRVLQAESGYENAPTNWVLQPGEGISEKALLTGELQYWPDVTLEPGYRGCVPGARSEVDVPIRIGDTVLGMLIVQDTRVDAFNAGDFDLLQAVTNQIAIALENTRLFLTARQELTERKQAEEALLKSQEKYRDMVENINEVIYTLDEKGVATYASPMITTMLGYQPSEVIGQPFAKFVFEEDVSEVKEQFNKVYANKWEPHEYRVRTKTGEPRWIRASSRPIYEEGRVVGIQGMVTDITAMKHLEGQLRQAQKMEAIGTLAGGIAHDFNNILGIIVGNTELALLDIQEASPTCHNLEEIRKACLRARDVVLQILSFSRQAEAERRPLKLGLLLRESLKLLRSSIPSSINIQQHILSQKDIILADATQISQVLLNLCTNAVHAMRETGGMLEISLKDMPMDADGLKLFPGLKPGDYVRLSISDTGHGIDPAIIDRIFDPYFTTKKVGEGTGLGLAVVHGIVKNHGGSITVESLPGQGSTFHVLLPCISAEPESGVPLIMELPKGHERVLFVEDERAVADALKLLLEKLGYIVMLKTSSLEALEIFRDHPEEFDLVITDQTMPVMTGVSLAKEMLKIRPAIPIILCTGYSEQVNEENAKAIGIKAFIMKPIMMQEMAKILRKVLGKGEGVLPFSS